MPNVALRYRGRGGGEDVIGGGRLSPAGHPPAAGGDRHHSRIFWQNSFVFLVQKGVSLFIFLRQRKQRREEVWWRALPVTTVERRGGDAPVARCAAVALSTLLTFLLLLSSFPAAAFRDSGAPVV